MKHGPAVILVLVIGCIALAGLGLAWKERDYERIRELDYHLHYQCIMSYEDYDRATIIDEIRKMSLDGVMHIMEERQLDDDTLEIIGQTGRSWLL